MATRTTQTTAPAQATGRHAAFRTTGLLNGDDSAPADIAGFDSATVQIAGTFGTGGTAILEATNDGTTWAPVLSLAGTAISLTAAGIVALQTTAFRQVRARVTGGDGTTNLSATIFARNGTAV